MPLFSPRRMPRKQPICGMLYYPTTDHPRSGLRILCGGSDVAHAMLCSFSKALPLIRALCLIVHIHRAASYGRFIPKTRTSSAQSLITYEIGAYRTSYVIRNLLIPVKGIYKLYILQGMSTVIGTSMPCGVNLPVPSHRRLLLWQASHACGLSEQDAR